MTAILDLPRVTTTTFVIYVMHKDPTILAIMPMDYDLEQARRYAPAGTAYFYFEQKLEMDGGITDTYRIPGKHWLIGQRTENCGSVWDNTLVLSNGWLIALEPEDTCPSAEN